MKQVYEEMITLHKEMVPLYELQENLKFLKTTYAVIDVIQEWGAKYLNIPAELIRKWRNEVEMDKVEIRMFIQVYE